MNIDEVEASIISWAQQNGILGVNFPPSRLGGGDPSILPFSADKAEFFRTRKIVRVVSQSDVGRIIIFSRLPIAKTKREQLVAAFSEAFGPDITLQVDASKPFRVDQALQSYGQFEPIRRHKRRIACGSSVGLGNQRNAGTLTALARMEDDPDTLYGVSCNHVTGGCCTARPGTPIVVPGIQDVSSQHNEVNVIGEHTTTASMGQGLPSVYDIAQNHDVACFRIHSPKAVTSMQGSGSHAYDTPTTFASPERGLPVKKWGRSTGFTEGEVSFVNDTAEPIDYSVVSYFGPMNSQAFRGSVYYPRVIEVRPIGKPFSLSGDSGALVVTNDGREPAQIVGLVIAGERAKSVLLPLDVALDTIGLTLVAEHNT